MEKSVTLQPLSVPIPLDLAPFLKVSKSFLSHLNAGRKPVPLETAIAVMQIAEKGDKRLKGVRLLDMKPELRPAVKFLCNDKLQKRCQKKG